MKEFIEKLIGRLEEEKSDWNDDYNVPINKAIEIVNQLAEQYNNGWIDCSERLPENGQTVIFSTEEGMVEAGWYDVDKDWCVNDSYFPNAFRFIVWQPLPPAYKPKE